MPRNHGIKFGESRITFDPIPHIKSSLEIHVYACKSLKNIGIVMKLGMKVYFVNLNHIIKICYGRSLITPRSLIGPIKKTCLAIKFGIKIVLPR